MWKHSPLESGASEIGYSIYNLSTVSGSMSSPRLLWRDDVLDEFPFWVR